MASNPNAQNAKKSPVQVNIFMAAIFPTRWRTVMVPREINHDGTHSLTQFWTVEGIMDGQVCLDAMLMRFIVVVPSRCNVSPTICCGTGGERGEGMNGDHRCEGWRVM